VAWAAPTITLDRDAGFVGDSIKFTVKGFNKVSTIKIYWDDGRPLMELQAGLESGTFTVPRAEEGHHHIVAHGKCGEVPKRCSAFTQFSIKRQGDRPVQPPEQVGRFPQVIIDSKVTSGQFRPGDTVFASVTIENIFTSKQTFHMEFYVRDETGNRWYADSKWDTLVPEERHTYSLGWPVFDYALTGPYSGEVFVFDGIPGKKGNVLASNENLYAFRVIPPLEPTFEVEMQNSIITVGPRDSFTYNVVVRSLNKYQGTVLLSLLKDFSTSWINVDLSPSAIEVSGSFEIAKLTVELKSEGVEPGIYTASIFADDGSKRFALPLKFVVQTSPVAPIDVELTGSLSPSILRHDQSTSLALRVDNNGKVVRDIHVYYELIGSNGKAATSPDYLTEIFRLTPGNGTEFAVANFFTVDKENLAGVYTLRCVVIEPKTGLRSEPFVSTFEYAKYASEKPISSIETTDDKVIVNMKEKKKLTLIAVKNNDAGEIFGIQLKIPETAIKYVKAKGWERQKIDDNTVLVHTDEIPIKSTRSLIMILITHTQFKSVQWTVLGSSGQEITSGTSHL
jgi:hypothetical protein